MQTCGIPPRKVFNCIVDDSALVAGVKTATRNGIRQWVKNGQIRLFVPLHGISLLPPPIHKVDPSLTRVTAIDELQRQKRSDTRHGRDVEETLKWLDDATTKYPWAVTLQGGDQYYANWAEVERFAVPRPLFSESDHLDIPGPEMETETDLDGLQEDTATRLTLSDGPPRSPVSSAASVGSGSASPSSLQSLRSSISAVSPPTSPKKGCSSPAKAHVSHAALGLASSSAMVPAKLQPLINYILWRIHQELDPIAALESFIFLCNDPEKMHYARGFDIKYKRLEQLREVIGKEDRDFRNRMSMQNRESSPIFPGSNISPKQSQQDDEVVYNAASRTRSSIVPKQEPNVIDPNAFDRTAASVVPSPQPTVPIRSPRQSHVQPSRGAPLGSYASRGNLRGNFRGGYRGRGNYGSVRSGFASNRGGSLIQQSGQIDPDSFVRPRGGNLSQGRKLWEPE